MTCISLCLLTFHISCAYIPTDIYYYSAQMFIHTVPYMGIVYYIFYRHTMYMPCLVLTHCVPTVNDILTHYTLAVNDINPLHTDCQ